MPGIARFSAAQQANVGIRLLPLEQRKARSFADIQAVSIAVGGSTRLCGYQLKRIEAVQRHLAQAVDASDDRCVAEPRAHEALRDGEDLGAGRARRGYDFSHTTQSEHPASEIGHREHLLRGPVAKVVRQRVTFGIARGVSNFRLPYTGGRCAEKYTDASSSIPVDRFSHGVRETICFDCELRQPVVATVIVTEVF